uniref:Uncharacterized protein n=1 Tax=Trichobilharzia regenti TaxID=157069 RepID=A0AA85KEA5_TRIRE|nr:unnamed protein product [Trichobilharzia regenti]
MCITLGSFKKSVLAELGNILDEDFDTNLVNILVEEIENIWQEINTSARDSVFLSWEESVWPNVVKVLAEAAKQILIQSNITEKDSSSFSLIHKSLKDAFRDKISTYISTSDFRLQDCYSDKIYEADKPLIKNSFISEHQDESSQVMTECANDNLQCFSNTTKSGQISVSDIPSDAELLKQIQAEPVIDKDQQPSFLTKSIGNEVILTPDVRPTDRRCVSEILIEPMGPLWDDFTDEIDEETATQLDRNLPTSNENEKIFQKLVNTISKPYAEMKFMGNTEDSKFNEIPSPDKIDLKPLYELTRQLSCHTNSRCKPLQASVSQSYLMDKSKWVLPYLKLHSEEDEKKFRRQKQLPNSRLDELFEEEMAKHSNVDMRKVSYRDDNSNEKYETILSEIKSEEQKLNRLKLESLENAHKSNKDALWNTGKDSIMNDKNDKLKLLKKCEAKIESLRLALKNVTADLPFSDIYINGKEKHNEETDDTESKFQARFHAIWQKLKLSETERQYCLVHFCLKNSSELIYTENINKALKMLEQAAEYVEQREMLLYKLAEIDAETMNMSKNSETHSSRMELTRSNERTKIQKSIKKLSKQIEQIAKCLKAKFDYTLTFDGQNYLTKMIHDQSDLDYLLRRKLKEKLVDNNVKQDFDN